MRALTVLLGMTGLATGVRAQELIPNPSFEQMTTCPTMESQLPLADLWDTPSLATPDYFHSCNTMLDSTGTPDNEVGSQAPFHGEAYGGFIALIGEFGLSDYREYMQTSLVGGPLEGGKTYRFEMQLCLAEDSSAATDRIGAYFSDVPVSSGSNLALPLVPQLETAAGTALDDTVEWMNISQTFVADGTEAHVTIGNFHDYANSFSVPAGFGPNLPLQDGTAYYYIDGVSLQCEPCFDPPMNLVSWWPLDEAGGLLSVDVVGALNGAHVGGALFTPGQVDGALDFLGTSISVPSAAPLELGTSDFTLDAWVRVDALGAAQVLISKIASTGPGFALVVNTDGTLSFTMIDAALGTASGSSTATLVAGAWSHVAVSVDRDDPSGGDIHIDGTLANFDPTSAPGSLSNTLPLLFATDAGAGFGSDLVGGLDEIEFFDRALAISEIVGLFEARTSGKCKTVLTIPPVVGVPVVGIPVVTAGTLTNGGLVTGTFQLSARGEPAGTRCGAFVSTIDGPMTATVLNPQPMQVAAGASVPVQLRLDAPQALAGGNIACYSVTMIHLESGRVFLSLGALRGLHPRQQRGTPPTNPPPVFPAR